LLDLFELGVNIGRAADTSQYRAGTDKIAVTYEPAAGDFRQGNTFQSQRSPQESAKMPNIQRQASDFAKRRNRQHRRGEFQW